MRVVLLSLPSMVLCTVDEEERPDSHLTKSPPIWMGGEKDWRRLGGSKKLGVKNVTPFSSLTVSDGSLEKICY